MDISNTRTILQIVKDTLREAKHKQWDFSQFIAMATWKPKVNNLCIQRFIARMKEKKLSIPDPSERFSYVVVNGLPLRDEKDQKIPRRNADYMEYPDFAKEHNMEIDINHYLEKTAGLCARFIMIMKNFNRLHRTKLCKSEIQMKEKSRWMHILRERP